MTFERMTIEDWFDEFQYVKYNIGESSVRCYKLGELGLNLNELELRYTPHLGGFELRSEIANMYHGLDAKNIGVTNGAAESIFSLIASLTTRNDHIIIEAPNYPSFRYIAGSLERDFNLFWLKFEDEFKPNLQNLEQMIKPNTKLLCLTHPNNPTGSLMTEKELKQIISIVEERDIYLLFDETYRELTLGTKMIPTAASLSKNAISVSTMSKIYGAPAIRIGWLATQQNEILEGVRRVREQITICNSGLNEYIATKILQMKENHMKNVQKLVNKNYAYLENWMQNQDYLEWIKPRGSVTCFPRLKSLESSERLSRLLVEKYDTFTVPGFVFNMPEYFRIGFGGNLDELKAGLNQLENALKEVYG